MAIALVQSNVANESAGDGSMDATWDGATTAGNLLVAGVAASRANTVPAITAPSGWVEAVTVTCDPGSGLRRRTAIYYKANASAESGAKTWACETFMGVASLGVWMAEYSGIAATTPLDKTASAADTSTISTTCGSGTTATQTTAGNLAVAALQGLSALGSPANGFTIQDQTGGATFIALADLVIAGTDAAVTSATYSTPSANAGAIATFLAAAAAPQTITASQTADATASAVAPTMIGGTATITVSQTATGTASGVAPTLTGGAVTITASQVASATASGVAPTLVPGVNTITVSQTASATASADATITLTPGAVSITATTATARALATAPTILAFAGRSGQYTPVSVQISSYSPLTATFSEDRRGTVSISEDHRSAPPQQSSVP